MAKIKSTQINEDESLPWECDAFNIVNAVTINTFLVRSYTPSYIIMYTAYSKVFGN